MKKQRLDKASNAIIGHLNINLFRNKFVFVEDITKLFDVFLVSESNWVIRLRANKLESTVANFLDFTVIVLEVD